MPRQVRPPPLPDVPRATVPEAATQRAITSIVTVLQAVTKFLRPYVQPEAWRGVAFRTPWADLGSGFHTTQYRKDPMGRVWLRGLCYRTTGAASANEVMFVLPLGYRPTLNCVLSCPTNSGVTTVQVLADGTVTWQSGGYTNVFFDGMSFDTEA